MAAQPLKLNHHQAQLLERDLFSFAQMAYRKILAEHAFQVAVSEEYRAGAVGAYQRVLLSEVRGCGRNFGLESRAAEFPLSLKAVHAAVAWTESACFEQAESFFDPFREPTLSMSLQIGGFRSF
jgi:hypothetical protein